MVKRREMEEPKVEIIPARKKAKKVCVGIYARVSTERKAQLTSLAAQISGLTRYCYRRQYPLKDIYIDVATGEKNTGRPGFTRLMRDCGCGAINLVMMKSMSRFGRDAVEVLEMYRRIHATGADVYFQEEDVDSRWENPEQWLAIGAAIAQAENESRSSDIKRGLAMRAADGRSGLYQRKCYGYRHGKDGKLEIQENQAKVVKEIFHLYMDGKSVDDIREQLYEEGIFTPNGEKKKWSRGSVTGVLHQGKYTGDVTISASDNIGSQVVMTEAIPAIISEDSFQKVQREMEKRTRRKVKK